MMAALVAGTAALSACGAGGASPAAQTAGNHQATSAALFSQVADQGTVPAALRVPAGQTMVADMRVQQGSQVYTCTNGSWTLLAPAAVLRSGNTQVLHTKGPQWISTADGSSVSGAVVASVPTPGAVPELLLRSTGNQGTGLFGSVDFIQRLDTAGGVAPAGQCANGTLRAVAYSADYRFYAPDADSHR